MSEQAFEALRRANEIRSEIHELKIEIGKLSMNRGLAAVAKVLEKGDDRAESMTIGALLKSIDHVGPARAERLLYRSVLGSSLSWRVHRLTQLQRGDLAQALKDHKT